MREVTELIGHVDADLPATDELVVPSRSVRLPLSWDDPSTHEAIQRYMHGVAIGCAVVPGQHRVHPADQRPGRRVAGVRHGVRRAVPGARARGRLPGRPGGHSPGSATPAGDHEVQPRPDLDAGERRRHRRGVHVHLRHGGSRRLPVRRADHAGVEPLPPARRAVLRAGHAVAAALLRPDQLLPRQRRGAAGPARRHGGRPRARSRSPTAMFSMRELRRASSPSTTSRSRRSASSRVPRSRPNGRHGAAPARSRAG